MSKQFKEGNVMSNSLRKLIGKKIAEINWFWTRLAN